MLQCPEICFLADRLIWISSTRNQGSKILDGHYLVVRLEKLFAKTFDIEPFVGGVLQQAMVEVEAIDIDTGSGQ